RSRAIPRGRCRRGKGWGGKAAPARGPPPEPAGGGGGPARQPPGTRQATPPEREYMFSIRKRRRPAPSTSRRARPRLETLEDRTTPAHLFVNTLSQTIDPTDNLLSLREAIEAVNRGSLSQLSTAEKGQVATAQGALGTNDTIEFQVAGNIGLAQELTLSRDVAIRGPGGTGLTVSGQGMCRVFVVGGGAHATLSDLTIAGGKGIYGGGIYNSGTLELANCTLSGNSTSWGGGIYNYGTATLDNCTLSGNYAGNQGGGIYNYGTA